MQNNPFQRYAPALPLSIILLAGATLHAQQATGLSNPSKIILGPAGTLLANSQAIRCNPPRLSTRLICDWPAATMASSFRTASTSFRCARR